MASDPAIEFQIVDYQPRFRDAFAALNLAWIERYFAVEPADREALENPEAKILDPGGNILFAVHNGQAVGTCALVPLPEQVVELAKMAVSDAYQGQGLGRLLGQAAIAQARRMNAQSIWLESNTMLKPAIALYRKLGFNEVPAKPSDYQRSNIQMTLQLY